MPNLAILLLLGLCVLGFSEAYNEDSSRYKWSPRFLYRPITYETGLGLGDTSDRYVDYGSGGIVPQRPSRFSATGGYTSMAGSRASNFEGSLGSRNPGFHSESTPYASRFTSFFKRANDYKRSGCVASGQVCLFRSGLAGAVMKLPCCPGSTCTLTGSSFLEEVYGLDDETNPPETIYLDQDDLGDMLLNVEKK